MGTDKEGEYISNGLKSYFLELCVQHQLTAANASLQKVIAEHMNKTLTYCVRSLLDIADLDKSSGQKRI